MCKCNLAGKQPAPPKKISGALLLLPLLVVLVPASYTQTTPAPTSETPTIVKDVDEVTLDLVVRKKNKPVLDLKPGDVTISDGGSPVTLSDLRLVTKASEDHLVTLVFDRLGPAAATNARSIAAKILKTIPATGFSFSVLRIDGRLKLFQEYTADRIALTKAVFATTAFAIEGGTLDKQEDVSATEEKRLIAVAQTGSDLAGVRVSVADRTKAQMMLAALRESQRIIQDQRTQPSLCALLALAREQRQIPGRKIVFYFAQGPQTDPNLGDMLRNVIGAANRSGVSIYAIDANTLSEQVSEGLLATMAMGSMRAASAQAPAAAAYTAGFQPLPQLPAGMQAQISDQSTRLATGDPSNNSGPLGQLAVSTGGAYVPAGQSLKKPLQRLIEDMTTYYEASYVPPIKDYDGQFRPVTVKPVLKGLKIKSRAGYFAVPPGGSGAGMRAFEVPLMKVLSDPDLPADIKFRSGILRLGDMADGNANTVVVEVPLAGVELRQDSNTNLFSARVSIVAQIKNKSGTVLEHFSEDVPRHGSLETIEKARSEVVTLQRHFVAGPGEYVVEAAVMDLNGGKTGAQRSTFEIAPAPDGPAVSDLSLVQRTDPFNVDTDAFEPMRYDNARVVPSLSGHISPDAKNVSLFFLIHPDSAATEPATLEMEVLRNGEPVGRTPLPLRKGSGQGAVPYLASIPASSLRAGNYEITASLTQNGKTSEHSVAFQVDGPTLASAAAGTESVGAASANGTGNVAVSDTNLGTPGAGPGGMHSLVITALPPSSIAAPTTDEIQALIADARERAISYSKSLPNFMCVEVTDRSVDPAGNGRWAHKDQIAELLRYHDNSENRVTLAVNGKANDTKRTDLRGKNGTLSQGEFGGVLNAVFDPSSKAGFQWKETDAIGSDTVQVISYHVARENSSWGLAGDNNWKVYPAFHGLLYIDAATRGVRRITLEAEDMPADFLIHSASMTVDYDYVALSSHDFLMPIRATVSLKQGKRESVLNEMEFRNYKRYGSSVKVMYGGQVVP